MGREEESRQGGGEQIGRRCAGRGGGQAGRKWAGSEEVIRQGGGRQADRRWAGKEEVGGTGQTGRR